MLAPLFFLSSLATLFSTAFASTALATPAVTTTIRGRLELPTPSAPNAPFSNGTSVSLNGGADITISSAKGEFEFYDVPPGVHCIEVLSTTHLFPTVKVQLLEKSMDEPKCNLYVYVGAAKQPISDCVTNLVLPAVATFEYFEKKPPFSIKGLFMNPMLLMMIVSGGAMWYMPKMMEGMDPEQKAAMAKQMEMQSDPSAMFAEMFGGGGEEEGGKKQVTQGGGGEKKARRGKRD